MADFTIKPTTGNLILKDDQNVARVTIAPTTGDITLGGQVSWSNYGFSAYLSTIKECPNATWTEINTTWTEFFDTDGKFGTTTGRFTPGVAGIYHCGYVADTSELDDSERILGAIRLNGSSTENTGEFARMQNRGTGADETVSAAASALIVLNTTDYVSLWIYQDSDIEDEVNINTTKFWGYFVGTV